MTKVPTRAESPMGPHPLTRLHIWQIQAVRDVLLVLAIIGLIQAGYAMRAVTVPLLVALLLAYLFEPLVSYLTHRFKTSRPVVVSGLVVSVGLSVLLLLAIVVPLVVGQTVRFVRDARAGRFEDAVLKLKEYVPAEYRADFERAAGWLTPIDRASLPIEPPAVLSEVEGGPPAPRTIANDNETRLRQIVREEIAAGANVAPSHAAPIGVGGIWDLAKSGGEWVFQFLGAIVQLGLLAFLIPFYFFFFSVSYPTVVKFGRDLLPKHNRHNTLAMIARMDSAVAGFVRGRIIICLLMGVMLAIGWLIVGVPYSIVLGLVIGAFCIVPYLGGIGIPLAVGLLAFDQLQLPDGARMSWWAILVWPTVVFTVVQIIESYILTPMIAGKATNLDPVTILVAVLAGGSVGGVYGMLLAIPVAACLKIVWTDVLLPKIRAWSRGEAQDPLPLSSG